MRFDEYNRLKAKAEEACKKPASPDIALVYAVLALAEIHFATEDDGR